MKNIRYLPFLSKLNIKKKKQIAKEVRSKKQTRPNIYFLSWSSKLSKRDRFYFWWGALIVVSCLSINSFNKIKCKFYWQYYNIGILYISVRRNMQCIFTSGQYRINIELTIDFWNKDMKFWVYFYHIKYIILSTLD